VQYVLLIKFKIINLVHNFRSFTKIKIFKLYERQTRQEKKNLTLFKLGPSQPNVFSITPEESDLPEEMINQATKIQVKLNLRFLF
jgi:hypothetical protein